MTCGKEYSKEGNLRSLHYGKNPNHAPDEWDVCNGCGKKFKEIGSHWRNSTCHMPEYTDKLHEITTGLVMSDACVRDRDSNPRVIVATNKKKYLQYLSEKFGQLCTNVRLKETGEKLAENARKSGFNENASGENYNDVYSLNIRNNPELNKYARWYDSGEKVWPEDITLTPTVLKHWFVGDGSKIQGKRGRPHISIQVTNEYENKEKITNYFKQLDIHPSNYCQGAVLFSCDQSEELWDYMGEAPPGHNYKWP